MHFRGCKVQELMAGSILFLCILLLHTVHGRRLHQSVKYPNTDLADYFVNIIDGDFVVGCNKFPIDGLNEWEVLEAGAGVPALTGSQLPSSIVPAQALRKVMDDAVSNGFTVLRAWAHGVTQQYATMTAPGKFNEALLRGLDYALVQARERGLKVILSFASNWTPAGGVDFYANATGVSHNDFFTNEATKSLYKSYIDAIVTRVNTISGVKYSEDPTIFAWDLLNEPVCRGCPKGTIATWVKEMAAYVKSLDTNHLLTVGEEGFYSTTQASIPFNPMYGQPGGTWAEEWGQDFVADHSDSNIDYASFHAWPDLWSCQAGCDALSVDFVQKWIDQHEKDAKSTLNKPLILEEFGKKPSNRDSYYKTAYDAVTSSLKAGGILKGALFWQFYIQGETASKGEGGGAGQFGVYDTDSAFGIVKSNAATVTGLNSAGASSCSKKANIPPIPECPAGYEGPKCNIDINECARGIADCGTGALCINTQGGYNCTCPLGTTGSGSTGCANDTSALNAALSKFWNDPSGQSCDQGINIPYPQNAAGWLEDPTGTFERDPYRQGVYGNRGPVTVSQCAIACLAASGCEAFTYNQVQNQCFLKAKQCPKDNNCQAPALICHSINDQGKDVEVSCGTWTTYYLQSVKSNETAYCNSLKGQSPSVPSSAG